MKLKEIFTHSQNLSACLDKIQQLLIVKEDCFLNSVDKINHIDRKIKIQENQIEQIIKQLNQCISQNQSN